MSVFSRHALRTAALYLLASALWLLLSDQLLSNLFDGSPALERWSALSVCLWLLFSAGWMFINRSRVYRQLNDGEQLQKQDRERLRMAAAVFESTLEGVLVTDLDGRIVHVNRAFMNITGYSQEEVLGQFPSKFKSGRHRTEFYRHMFQALAARGQWSGEIWNRRKSGEIYPQWQTICTIDDDHGQLSHYVAVFSDISAIKHSERELNRLAHHDPLTDLPNRLLFNDRTEQAVAAAQASRRGCALLLLDLDHFQSINDSLGHSAGDQLLKAVAERLKGGLTGDATLARLGGDEFAVLVEHCDQVDEVAALAQALIDVFKDPFVLDSHPLFVSASIGISLCPGDALSAEQLLRNADSALFKAKHSGRAGYALYTEELTARALQRVETSSELRRALERQELCVYYQPVHDLRSRRMIGVEALVRWQHPQRGLVPPADFIPIAERTGLISEIDSWVMRQACAQMVEWQAQGRDLEFVAMNVSSRSFGRPDLYHQVADVLRDTGLDPAFLELEVTESAVIDDTECALEQLHRLRELGLRLAIDDFGTGYSSLLRLKRLPVHKLKIDQGFVAGLPDDEDDAAIVRIIISLACSMGLLVHAEGIEHMAQAQWLVEQNCNMGQGYGLGRPVPAHQVTWS